MSELTNKPRVVLSEEDISETIADIFKTLDPLRDDQQTKIARTVASRYMLGKDLLALSGLGLPLNFPANPLGGVMDPPFGGGGSPG